MRLPPELRNKIYAYVFSCYKITIWPAYKVEAMPIDEFSWQSTPSIFQALVAPMYTCRQMHAETRLLPYKYSLYRVAKGCLFVNWLYDLVLPHHTGHGMESVERLCEGEVGTQGYTPEK